MEDCRFLDYGNFNGEYHDIRGISTQAWLLCRETFPLETCRAQNCLTVRNTRMDEGAACGIFVNPTKHRVSRVHIDGLEDNVARGAQGIGVHLRNVDYAVIENSFIGYNAGEVGDAIRLSSVASARLERVLCLQNANRVTADALCGKLTLEDCVYKTLNSAAKKTIVL